MTRARTDVEQVREANTAFYEALERGDFDTVSDLWLDPADLADGTGSGGPSTLTAAIPRLVEDPEDLTDVRDVTEVMDISDVADITDITDVTGVADLTDLTDLTGAGAVPRPASYDDSENDDGDSDSDDEDDDEDADRDSGDRSAAISCVHPGWPVLTGRGEVLRSYALIMANTEYIQFFLTDVRVSVAGDTALVTCTENILSGGPAPRGGDELGPLVGQLVVATNVFRRTPGGWKLWSHHASPVLAESGDDEDDETPS